MMAKERREKLTQLSVWIDKETRINLSKLMEMDSVPTQAAAISLALRIAVRHLAENGGVRDDD